MTDKKRVKALYNYICLSYVCGHGYITQEKIAASLPEWYEVKKGQDFHSQQARKNMSADIQYINDCEDFPCIVLSNGNGVKIATEEEAARHIKNLYKACFGRLKRIRKIERKARLDGQVDYETEIRQSFV